MDFSDYVLYKDLTPAYTMIKNRIGIYINSRHHKVVVKKANLTSEKLNAKFIKHEGLILKKLSEIKKVGNLFPQFVDLSMNKGDVYLITELKSGQRLDLMNTEIRKYAVKKVLIKLQVLAKSVNSKNKKLPTTNPLLFFGSFIIYFLKAILKDSKRTGIYIKLTIYFYINYILGIFGGFSLRLSHRDLWPDNIHFGVGGEISLLDWESAKVTDSLYDLSQIAMIYTQDFGSREMVDLLKEQLENNSQKRRFIGLAIYNSMQMLSNIKTEDVVFEQIHKFLKILEENIYPSLFYKKTPFELVNSLTLNLIWLFYKVSGLSMNNKSKKIMLCYHSVGNDGWRFSTRIETLANHLNFLKKNYNLMSLTDLLSSRSGGLNISFDDGYQNVLTNALPLFAGIPGRPTIFVLGDPVRANRVELDNNLPLMTIEEVIKLKKQGWEVGFHTSTHPDLTKINSEKHHQEILRGKKNFEEKTGLRLKYFAYPKGRFSNEIVEKVREAGFESAFTVDGKEITHDRNDKMLLDRVPIEGDLSEKQLSALISPLGLLTSQFFLKALVFKDKFFCQEKIKL